MNPDRNHQYTNQCRQYTSNCRQGNTNLAGLDRLRFAATVVLQSRRRPLFMPSSPKSSEAILEVVAPDGTPSIVRVTESPFLIGRGGETGNHLNLNDRRISRLGAAIVRKGNQCWLEDRGQRWGIFLNGEKVENRALEDGNVITFGLTDSYEIIFRHLRRRYLN